MSDSLNDYIDKSLPDDDFDCCEFENCGEFVENLLLKSVEVLLSKDAAQEDMDFEFLLNIICNSSKYIANQKMSKKRNVKENFNS